MTTLSRVEEEKITRAATFLGQLCDSAEVRPMTKQLVTDVFLENCHSRLKETIGRLPVSILVYGFLKTFCQQLIAAPTVSKGMKREARRTLKLFFNIRR